MKIHSIFRFVLLTLLWPLFFSAYAQEEEGQIPDSVEIHALTQFYASTNGDEWDDNKNWLKSNKWPDWEGVTYENGDVVGLDLFDNRLKGTIPKEFYELRALVTVDFAFNELSGRLTKDVGQLTDLEYFILARNQLSGTLPPEIGQLTRILELDLSANNFDGAIPPALYDLVSLERLYLGTNLFSGKLPEKIGNLVRLEVLSIGDNLFEGRLPASFGNLSNLSRLSLDYCQFSGEIPDSFRNLTSLKFFVIPGNQFSGVVPQFFSELPLTHFVIFKNRFQGIPDFSNLANPSSLIVSVYDNQLDFGDLEPNWTAEGSIFQHPRYPPQDSVATFYASETRTYSVEVGGVYNRYQWHKNGTEIPGATHSTYVASSNNESDTYQCRITNTRVEYLTLWSKSRVTRAGQYYAVADGNWNELIWSREKDGAVTDTTPGADSEVFIIGKNVTLRQNVTTGPVHVVVDQAGASLTVDRAVLTIRGNLDLSKTHEGHPGGVKVVNGGRIAPRPTN
ncbi:MAG: hypothetical protein AAGA66_07980 [Bacteroidota bacterium]